MSEHPSPGEGYWYMAGPYSDNISTRYKEHLSAAACLTRANITVYSPIVHYHDLAHTYDMPTDVDYWREHNFNMIRLSLGLILLKLPNWEASQGVKGELLFARMKALPIWGLIPPTTLDFSWVSV